MSFESLSLEPGESQALSDYETGLADQVAQRLRVANEEAGVQLRFYKEIQNTVFDLRLPEIKFNTSDSSGHDRRERQHKILMAAAKGPATEGIRDRQPMTRH